MILAMLLVLLGAALGIRNRVFVLIPVGFVILVSELSIWIANGELAWTTFAICFGYLAALNLGYIIGGLVAGSRDGHNRLRSSQNDRRTTVLPAHRRHHHREA